MVRPAVRLGLGAALLSVGLATAMAAPPATAVAPTHSVALTSSARTPVAHKPKVVTRKVAEHRVVRHKVKKKRKVIKKPASLSPAALPVLPVPSLALPIVPGPAATPSGSPSQPASPATTPAAAASSGPPAAGPSPTVSVAPTSPASPTPGSRPLALGVTVAADDDDADVSAYTAAAGRNPAILMWYSNWGGPIAYGSQVAENDRIGSTPMITWDPTDLSGTGIPLDDIASGTYDPYIDASAAGARNYGKPVLIRFAHEMNLSGSPYGPGNTGDTAASFVAAWQHVVSRFAADGATNVRWVWSPNVDCGGGCPFDAFYPGDSYVDYVALDGYNYASVHSIAPESFTQVFGESYADLTALTGKPAMIAETATAGADTDKAAWIDDAFLTAIPAHFPGLVALVWFDRDKEFDWRVNADTPTLTAWQRDAVDNPAYQGTLSW